MGVASESLVAVRGQKPDVGSWQGEAEGAATRFTAAETEQGYLPETTMASFGPQVKNMIQESCRRGKRRPLRTGNACWSRGGGTA